MARLSFTFKPIPASGWLHRFCVSTMHDDDGDTVRREGRCNDPVTEETVSALWQASEGHHAERALLALLLHTGLRAIQGTRVECASSLIWKPLHGCEWHR